jgi:hypothetical protein
MRFLELICHVDDRHPVPHLITLKLFVDKSYLSQQLCQRGITLITRLKSNIKNHLDPAVRQTAAMQAQHSGSHHRSTQEHHSD